MQSSFTNPHDMLLCRVILCRAFSSGNKTPPEDRSPEKGLELVLDCRIQVGTIFCVEKLPLRGLQLSVSGSISQRCVGSGLPHLLCQMLPGEKLPSSPTCSTIANPAQMTREGVQKCVCLSYSSSVGSWRWFGWPCQASLAPSTAGKCFGTCSHSLRDI